MMRRRASGLRALGLALLLAGGALLDAGTAGAVIRGSALALPLLADHGRLQLSLAQRAIGRSWGLSEDSSYSEVEVPEWRSAGLAAGFSAVVPGAGQLYAGEGGAVWFALAEVAGWTANRIYLHKAQTERDRSAGFAGDPTLPSSAWSFDRFGNSSTAPGKVALALELEAIWAKDRQAFYEMIARNPTYLAGWSGESAAKRSEFLGIRDALRGYFDRASAAGHVLWLNHLIAALDALRAARLHNLVLQNNLELKLRSSWQGGRPAIMAALVRRF
jgi:hypothetical protein